MSWFRNHIRTGTHLALMALALQFVLALSHVHLPDALTSHGHAGQHSHATALVEAAHDHGAHAHDHQLQQDHDHGPAHHHAQEFCALCAVATQALGMLASVASTLPVLHQTTSHCSTSDHPLALIEPCASFNSRAPPIA